MSYFKPLRRKVGLITLALACLFTVWRMRSDVYGDEISMNVFGRSQACYSKNGILRWSGRDGSWPLQVSSYSFLLADLNGSRSTAMWESRIRFYRNDPYFRLWEFPHLSVVIPLILLSAWLFLSKPRKKSEPTPI